MIVMNKEGEAGILGAVLIAFLIISAIATYTFISRESDAYINTVNRSLQTRERKIRESLDVSGYLDTKTLEIKNRGDIQSHIVAFILLNNQTGEMNFYRYDYRLSPMDDVRIGFNEMGSYPPYISGVLTDLGNIFWDETITQGNVQSKPLGVGDNITDIYQESPLDFDSWSVVGDHIAELTAKDVYGNKYLYLFNTTDGRIIAVNHISSGDGLIKIYTMSFSTDINFVYVNGSPIKLPHTMLRIDHIGYDYMILDDGGGNHMDIVYSNGDVKEYSFTVNDGYHPYPGKITVRNDLIIYKKYGQILHYYRLRNGRVLYDKVIESPFLFNGYLPYFEPGGDVLSSYSVYGYRIYLLNPDDDTAPDTYNGYPSLSPDFTTSASGSHIYSFNYPLTTYILTLHTSHGESTSSANSYNIYHYFLYKNSNNYWYVRYYIRFTAYNDVEVVIYLYRVVNGVASRVYTGWNERSVAGYTRYERYIVETTVIIKDPGESSSKIGVEMYADGYVSGTGGYGGASTHGTYIFTMNSPYPENGGFNSPHTTTLKLYYDDPFKVAILNGNDGIYNILNDKTLYKTDDTHMPGINSRASGKLYMVFTVDDTNYDVGVYDISSDKDYGLQSNQYPPGLYLTTDGMALTKIKGISGMTDYGKPYSILLYGSEMWIVYKTPDRIIVVKG